MHIRQNALSKIYNQIENSRKKFGDYKKCEFHIHTPESKCFKLKKNDTVENELDEDIEEQVGYYHKMSTKEVVEYAKECGYLTENQHNTIVNNLAEYESDDYLKLLNNKDIPFKSSKEYFAYMLIAFKLYKEDIDVAVICDHNTIDGFYKLKYALNKYYEEADWTKVGRKRLIYLFLGVEISCADLNHLVVIADESRYEFLNSYLKKIIMGENLGSYYNTGNILNELGKENFIMYIAHSQSSELHGNKVYNQYVFNNEGLKALGITNKSKKHIMREKIKNFTDNDSRLGFIYEGDSHYISGIGIKNTWIKFQKINFTTLMRSIKNHQICISIEEPMKTSRYIKGIAIEKGDYGFLGLSNDMKNNNKEYLSIPFSSDLNCIIGGKGTGKSTILNIIELIYSQKADNMQLLKFISRHKRIFSTFTLQDEEYIIEFIPQVSRKNYGNYIFESSFIKEDGIYKLNEQWYNVYKVIKKDKKVDFKDIKKDDISDLLSSVLKRGYGINRLVEKIDNGDIKEYVKEIVTYGVNYNSINYYLNQIRDISDYRFMSKVRDILPQITNELDLRKEDIDKAIRFFNDRNLNSILLDYRNTDEDISYLEPFLMMFESDESIANTALRWRDLQKFFIDISKKIGFLKLLEHLFNQNFNSIEKLGSIKNYQVRDLTVGSVQVGLSDVNKENVRLIYKDIYNRIRPRTDERGISNNSGYTRRDLLERSILQCCKVMDEINIKFNVNLREDVITKGKNFKNIENLSSGQKVAAILTFVFQFGIASNDNTPLIIDQPEDNLDNSYIYKTLVNSLKEVKDNRQVIIVTHSSTIVTNANSEEVIVMNSDGNTGWIEAVGYPSEKVITKHIMNYLEGGEKSFRHKMDMYQIAMKI